MRRVLPAAVMGVMASAVVAVWGGLGLLSLPGLALLAIVAPACAIAMLWWAPWLPFVITTAIIPFPQAGVLFPFEFVFLVASTLAILHLLRTRSPWLMRSHPAEIAQFAFVGWALFSGLWAIDGLHLFLGTRRMLVGLLAGWLALRLHAVVPRRHWEISVLLAATVIAGTALVRGLTSGFSTEQVIFHRSSSTDLGWGTANYIATLLLILSPLSLTFLFSERSGATRLLAGFALTSAAALQIMVASRAAAVLFFAGLFTQVILGLRRRTRWAALLALGVALAIGLATPYGQALIARFSNLRDLGSMVVRIWYFREGWLRTTDNLPWGIGLNQGIPYSDKLGTTDIHNHWLVVSSELGIPGVLLWLGVLVLLFRGLRSLDPQPDLAPIALALKVSFWLGLLHSLVEPTFQGVQYQFLWFWLMFGAIGYGSAAAAEPRVTASSDR